MTKPVFNFIVGELNHFLDEHILYIPQENRQAFRDHLEDLLLKAIEAGAKGTAEGLKKDE